MLDDSDRLLATIEQVLRTGRIGSAQPQTELSRRRPAPVVEECVEPARALHHLPPEGAHLAPGGPPCTCGAD